ncbi:MAG: GntR family transcriptional regulator [Anaerovoracaceae bacterium]|jgi:DNA-binding GntR family transcriptional regulator
MSNENNAPALDKIINPERIRKIQSENPFMKLSDIVYDMLEEAILVSAFEAGTKLNVSRIAERLDISGTPVSTATDRLVKEGFLIENSGKKGKYRTYQVFDITNEEMLDLFYARQSLECATAKACAERHSLVDDGRLRELAAEFSRETKIYGNNFGMSRVPLIDIEFHKTIAEQSANSFLIKMYDSISPMLRYMSVRTSEFVTPDQNSETFTILSSQHMTILEGIMSGIPETASAAMKHHIDYCMKMCMRNRGKF